MQENRRLRKELKEVRKENLFLKSSGILCKRNRLEAYRFIANSHQEFGLRWLLRILHICPNAYYNYIKSRKSAYYAHKETVKQQIQDIYHSHNGVVGYRAVRA